MASLQRKRSQSAAAQRAVKIARLADMLAVSGRRSVAPIRRQRFGVTPEIKHFDTSLSMATVASAADWTGTEVTCSNYIQSDGTTLGAYTDCALIPSAIGSGYGEVIGTKYLIKGLRIRGELRGAASTGGGTAIGTRTVRLVLVHDKMPQGAQAQGEVIYPDMGSAPQCNYSYLALGSGTGGRFQILADKVVTLEPGTSFNDAAATGTQSWNTKVFQMNLRFARGIPVNLKAGGTSPATSKLSDCNIFLLAHVSASTPTVSLEGCARCDYVD